MNKRFIAILLAGLLSASAWSADAGVGQSAGRPAAPAGRPLVVDQPYSATHTLTMRRQQRDGAESIHRTVTKLYRDSAGRARRDLLDGEGNPTHSFIIDTDGAVIVLDHRNRLVKRRAARRVTPVIDMSAPAPRKAEARPPVEPLGERDIEGVTATGESTRHRIRTAAGSFEIVTESWTSKELGLTLHVRNSDPKGESVIAISDLERGEPDPALFAAPEDYQVKPEA